MKATSRGERGKRLMRAMDTTGETSMKKFPWKNPFKGGIENLALAEIGIKGAGMFVGFKIKF